MTVKTPDEATKPPVGRDTIRSRLVLEVASEMVDQPGWQHRQARVSLRPQGADHWAVTFFASDGPAAIDQVARGDVQMAISNPAGYLALAKRGTGPFAAPISLRAITVIPSPDQLAFAVTQRLGLKSLQEIRGAAIRCEFPYGVKETTRFIRSSPKFWPQLDFHWMTSPFGAAKCATMRVCRRTKTDSAPLRAAKLTWSSTRRCAVGSIPPPGTACASCRSMNPC